MAVFKSYDIRGIYPTQLGEGLARKIGGALARYFRGLPENHGKAPLRIVVGRDMRTSAPSMSAALIDGLLANGVDVIDIGMVTTPCCYFGIERLKADGGVQVTASHNPPQYIGFKVSRELAIPVSYDTGLAEVESMLDETERGPNGKLSHQNVDDAYIDFLAGMAKSLLPITVAADASNGMAGKYLTKLCQRLGVKLEGIYLDPDGTFPNHEADPLKPENLKDLSLLVPKAKAAIGFCFDGDADRVAVVDEAGVSVGCDLITALIAQHVLKDHPGKPATYDLRSSKVVKEVIEAAGGKAVRVRVGHAHVKRIMREIGAVCGGELSGHYYFELHDGATTYYADSAFVAMIQLLNVLSSTGKSVSQLIAPLRKYYHTGEINFAIPDKEGALASIREAFSGGKQDFLDGVTVEYPDWWVNVRPSNTEPLLRLTLEGNSADIRDSAYARVSAVLEKYGTIASGGH